MPPIRGHAASKTKVQFVLYDPDEDLNDEEIDDSMPPLIENPFALSSTGVRSNSEVEGPITTGYDSRYTFEHDLVGRVLSVDGGPPPLVDPFPSSRSQIFTFAPPYTPPSSKPFTQDLLARPPVQDTSFSGYEASSAAGASYPNISTSSQPKYSVGEKDEPSNDSFNKRFEEDFTGHPFAADLETTAVKRSSQSSSRIPRPPNAFILFRSSFIKSQKISGNVEGNGSTLSKIVGILWRNLKPEERSEWEKKAQVAHADHCKRYPDWRFNHAASEGKRRSKKIKDGPETVVEKMGTSKTTGGQRTKSGAGKSLDVERHGIKHKGKAKNSSKDGERVHKIVDLLEEGKTGIQLEYALKVWEQESGRAPSLDDTVKSDNPNERDDLETSTSQALSQGHYVTPDSTTHRIHSSFPELHSSQSSGQSSPANFVPLHSLRSGDEFGIFDEGLLDSIDASNQMNLMTNNTSGDNISYPDQNQAHRRFFTGYLELTEAYRSPSIHDAYSEIASESPPLSSPIRSLASSPQSPAFASDAIQPLLVGYPSGYFSHEHPISPQLHFTQSHQSSLHNSLDPPSSTTSVSSPVLSEAGSAPRSRRLEVRPSRRIRQHPQSISLDAVDHISTESNSNSSNTHTETPSGNGKRSSSAPAPSVRVQPIRLPNNDQQLRSELSPSGVMPPPEYTVNQAVRRGQSTRIHPRRLSISSSSRVPPMENISMPPPRLPPPSVPQILSRTQSNPVPQTRTIGRSRAYTHSQGQPLVRRIGASEIPSRHVRRDTISSFPINYPSSSLPHTPYGAFNPLEEPFNQRTTSSMSPAQLFAHARNAPSSIHLNNHVTPNLGTMSTPNQVQQPNVDGWRSFIPIPTTYQLHFDQITSSDGSAESQFLPTTARSTFSTLAGWAGDHSGSPSL